MRDDEIVALLKADLREAEGYDSDELDAIRSKALDYYQGKMDIPAKGRSDAVSYDVADTVNSLMAQIAEIYRGSAVEFAPESSDDEEQARIESDAVRRVIEENDHFETIEGSSFDALLTGNGWIRCEVRDSTSEIVRVYESPDPEELAAVEAEIEGDEDTELEVDDDGNVRVTVTEERREIITEPVAPELIVYTGRDECGDIQRLRLVAERKLYRVAELMDMGLTEEEAKTVPDYGIDTSGEVARRGPYSHADDQSAQDETQLKETWICYWLAKLEGDDVQRWRIHLAGDNIVGDKERVNYVPYITGSPLPMPHRVAGQGMYEIMRGIQDNKTKILRNYLDNLEVLNRSRLAYVRGQVDLEELLSGRLNGVVGMDHPDAIKELPSNDIGPQALAGMNYLDQVRTQRGAAALELNQPELQVAQSSALAASMEYASKEQMSAYYCRNLAQSLVRGLFLMVHRLLREEYARPVSAKVRGEWQQVEPSSWRERRRARVVVGLSNAERSQRLQGLTAMLQQQQAWIEAGLEGVITDKQRVFNAASDWIRYADLSDHPDEYIIDPSSPQAIKAMEDQARAAAEQEQQMQAMQQQLAAMQAQQVQAQRDHEKELESMKLRQKYFEALLDAELKEGEMTVDLTKTLSQAEQASDAA